MRTIILSAALFIAVNVTGIYGFGGGHDSLLFDGESEIRQVQSYSGECPVKIKYASGKNNGVKRTKNVMTDCSGKVLDTLDAKESGQLKKDDILYLGEEVSTGDDGVVEIELWDGSFIRMAPNTTIKIIDEYCAPPKIIQITGKIWNKIKRTIGGHSFEVNGRRLCACVRGTEFSTEFNDVIDIVKVYESSVEVKPSGTSHLKVLDDKEKEMDKLTEDFENGKITMDEYMKKSQEYITAMQETSVDMTKSVIVEAGYMVTAEDKINDPEPIPADDIKWFEDGNFYK
jgi:hypothetical protein